jgi:hypothetical protein
MKTILLLLSIACFGLLASPSRAQVIPVGNYSFTSPGLPGTAGTNYDASQTEEEYSLVPGLGGQVAGPGGGGATNEAIPGWTAATSGDVAGTDNPVAAMFAGTGGSSSDGLLPGTADGYTFALINVGAGESGSLTYSGPSLGNFTIGQTYTLTVAIGQRLDTPTSSLYTIELLNGGLLADASTATSAVHGTFTDLSLSFTDLADTGTIGIELYAANSGSGNFEQASFDNVRLVETPEPSTHAEILGGCMLLGLVAWNRRRFRA